MSEATDQPLPSKRDLVRSTVIALVAALVLLVTTILPSEYGIDPTGIGGALGLTALAAPSTGSGEEVVPDAEGLPLEGASLAQADTNLQKDTLTVVVPAYEGVELKAKMQPGQSLAFDWRTADGEALYTDMHGEPPNAAEDEFTSYWKENEQSAGQGTLVAQFEGTHGWYWQNMSEEDVTVNIDVSGFYQEVYEVE